MSAMDDAAALRRQAWAGLVDEVAARPPTAGDVALVLREHPTLARRTREAHASAGMARQALARMKSAPPLADPIQEQMLRAWTSCVDEILTLTERLCGGLAAAAAA